MPRAGGPERVKLEFPSTHSHRTAHGWPRRALPSLPAEGAIQGEGTLCCLSGPPLCLSPQGSRELKNVFHAAQASDVAVSPR